jgi:alpha-galactosidase
MSDKIFAASITFIIGSGASLLSSILTIASPVEKYSCDEMNLFPKNFDEQPAITPNIPYNEKELYAFQQDNIFLLGNASMQYVLQIDEDTGKLFLLHWGDPVSTINPLPYDWKVSGGDEYSSIYSDFPIYGDGDDREPALKISSLSTGISSFDFKYQEYQVYDGKIGELNSGMPSTYTENDDEAKTLLLKLHDKDTDLELRLYYTIFRDFNAIARHAEIVNNGKEAFSIDRISSCSCDLPPSPHEEGYKYLQLRGAWAREAQEVWNKIDYGKYVVGDSEGSQVHRAQPFVAVTDGIVGEETGIVRGFSLIYSGAFQSVLQTNQMGLLRINMGMHPDVFTWKLEPGETFNSPESVAVYSSNGLGQMSRDFHRLYRTRLARGEWRDRLRPILLNTWEPFQFTFTHDSLVDLAKSAQGTGVELFVLDDGWFGARDSSNAGLGDWYPNTKKLPKGLKGLADDINALGLDFGLWVEPESVNPDSDLYRAHPEWAVEVPGKPGIQMRDQLLLDMANEEVQNHLINVFTDLFASANIVYVKWDHNRFVSNPFSRSLPPDRQGEFCHRYILGLYNIVRTLTNIFPQILFESCAGGGGRFDPGMLAYMPQSWASDNTDVEERIKIQWGFSYVYPLSMLGAHVSTVPNHQVERVTDWGSRAAVAHFGTFGYELNMLEFTEEDKKQALLDSNLHISIRHLVHHGDWYRLRNPYKSNWPGWMCVSSEGSDEAIVMTYQRLRHTRETIPSFLLKGLDMGKMYAVMEMPDAQKKFTYGGDELMKRGLVTTFSHDFEAHLFYVCEIGKFAEMNL